jgi:excinuclease ABC subunit B
MQRAIEETNRRRQLQTAYNEKHGITPETIRKAIRKGIEEEIKAHQIEREAVGVKSESQYVTQEFLNELEAEMLSAAQNLEFERAAQLRDRIQELTHKMGQAIDRESKPKGRKPQKARAKSRSRRKGQRIPKPERP